MLAGAAISIRFATAKIYRVYSTYFGGFSPVEESLGPFFQAH